MAEAAVMLGGARGVVVMSVLSSAPPRRASRLGSPHHRVFPFGANRRDGRLRVVRWVGGLPVVRAASTGGSAVLPLVRPCPREPARRGAARGQRGVRRPRGLHEDG